MLLLMLSLTARTLPMALTQGQAGCMLPGLAQPPAEVAIPDVDQGKQKLKRAWTTKADWL